jgi:UDP-hydrolysing UDP-N-acetyl-D-glucosamine 2-epimerase
MIKKICIPITSRGNYGKVRSIVDELTKSKNYEIIIMAGGSATLEKYGNIFASDYINNIPRVHNIQFLLDEQTPYSMAQSTGNSIIEFSKFFKKVKPDLVFVIADRFESLVIAIASTYMNIPIVHLEGGEVTGSIDESIRHAISKLAHIHFPATTESKKRLIKMGEDPKFIHNVGSTSFDLLEKCRANKINELHKFQDSIDNSPSMHVESKKYLVVVKHPITTEYDNNYKNTMELLKAINEINMKTFWIMHNMDAGSDGINKVFKNIKNNNIILCKSMPLEIFGTMLNHAACIIGNSSAGIRESSFLGLPSVNIGDRQKSREKLDNVIDIKCDHKKIYSAIKLQLKKKKYKRNFTYGNGSAGKKIASILSKSKIILQKKITY